MAVNAPTAADRLGRARLRGTYDRVRAATERLCDPLEPEDFIVQTMDDVSPQKWHLAHTAWFFETLVLLEHVDGYEPYHDRFQYLFNSYYNTLGRQYCRPDRGFLIRPTIAEVFAYRKHVDERIADLIEGASEETWAAVAPVLELGCHHEQQHQELMLMDIKHVFASNPIVPVYRAEATPRGGSPAPVTWESFPEATREIGTRGDTFHFDNEGPRHRVLMPAYRLASRLVTAGEYLEFMGDGGYSRPELWLSDGWAEVQARGWDAPLYWAERDGEWWMATLAGERPVRAEEPVVHVSLYEADAFARWREARLPTEAEWETAAATLGDSALASGNFVEDGGLHPRPASPERGLQQMLGDVWEWTSTPYGAYPGFRAPSGPLGEYNAKFMCNQMVLRGGGCATPRSHIRPTYRNFFPPSARWLFGGFRLAKDGEGDRG